MDRALSRGSYERHLGDVRAGRVLQLRDRREGALPGETRLTVGEPTWKMLDRESVEALVGQPV